MPPHPDIEPHDRGELDVGDGDRVYWEACGDPGGKPAVVLHGGPGSGFSPWYRTLFDPRAYRVILFDQRNCGRSTPHASDPATDLARNTTWRLVADIERLREHLGVDRWLVQGGSWGSTLALAYAVTHPERVTEMVLCGVTTGRHTEFDWLFRGGLARFFPAEWERLRCALPEPVADADVPAAYNRLLRDPSREVRERAAEAWCRWESATPHWPPAEGLSPAFRDPRHAVSFARIVTHYVAHNAWLDDGELLGGAGRLASIPGVLVNGRLDFQSPLEHAWTLKRAWPRAELVVIDEAGHTPTGAVRDALVRATDRFAAGRVR